MKSIDYKDVLPSDVEVIKTMNIVDEEFGGVNLALIVIESDPHFFSSDEVRDVRDPRILKYVDLLVQRSKLLDDVVDASSSVDILKPLNDGHIPKSISVVKRLSEHNLMLNNYISRDYSMTLVKVRFAEDVDKDEIEKDLRKVVEEIPKPVGVSVQLAGEETIKLPILKRLVKPDIQRTSTYSFIGILIVLLLLFKSVRGGLTLLSTIFFGIIWALGFVGLLGFGMSVQTSGSISMIMGIGIDFGIQIATRFKQELKNNYYVEKAMSTTLSKVFVPMITTTLAALIGFRAMSLGKLTVMAELGNIMSLGIAASMLAAISVVPALLILGEKFNLKKIKSILKEV
ncbi:MAG: MMPL family transporter [Nanoarchaeota archaeon]|nr:MMPL family transporter [Nanoarchaeota archaeon]